MLQHWQGQVDSQNCCTAKTIGESTCCGTCCAAEIKDHVGIDYDRYHALKQAVPGNAVYKIGLVKTTGGLIKAPANVGDSKCVLGVQGGNTLARFPCVSPGMRCSRAYVSQRYSRHANRTPHGNIQWIITSSGQFGRVGINATTMCFLWPTLRS